MQYNSLGLPVQIDLGNGARTTYGYWDAENRLTGITGGASATYVYDGNGFRVKKTEGSQTILYVNQYYEKNLTTATVTLYYYLGNKMAAYKAGASVTYVHQDHLTGTSLTTNDSGTEIGTIKYAPFGSARSFSGALPAQKLTGQRLDDVGLYYYGARYYDPNLARFISADTIVPSLTNPQALNRYSYVLNNPLKYVDPSGQEERVPEETAYFNGEISYEEYLAAYGSWASAQGGSDGQTNMPTQNSPVFAVSDSTNAGNTSGSSDTNAGPSWYERLKTSAPGLEILEEVFLDYLKSFSPEELAFQFALGMPGPKGLKQAHHLADLRFAKQVRKGVGKDVRDGPTEDLIRGEHQKLTNFSRDEIGYSNSRNPLNTDTATFDQVWDMLQREYAHFPELLARVKDFLFGK